MTEAGPDWVAKLIRPLRVGPGSTVTLADPVGS